jgi:hypothetical protein
MERQTRLIPALLLLAGIAACDSRTPTGPPTVTPPRVTGSQGLPPVFAEITLRSISPDAGATLLLFDCSLERGKESGSDFCTEEFQAVFAVAADRDMPSVALRVTFWEEGRPCAIAMTQAVSLSAHVAAELRATHVDYYVKDLSAASNDIGCDRLPVGTTTMVAELLDYSRHPGASVMTKNFPYGYQFAVW